MLNLKKIEIEIKDKLLTVWLNRPEVLNALDSRIFTELSDLFRWADTRDEIRVIIIRGRGSSFCAGADLKQMVKPGRESYAKSYSDSKKMADCFGMIYDSDKAVVNIIHGNAYGGAFGLIGAGDITIAERNTSFCIPEMRLGLVPAVILPFLLSKVNASAIKYQVFSGEKFTAEDALKKGIIDYVCDGMTELEQKADQIVRNICMAPAAAIADTKYMFRNLSNEITNPGNLKRSAKVITRRKMADETRKRIAELIAKK